MRQRLQSVGIDAAQVGLHQTARDRRRIFLGQIMRDQQPAAEAFRRFGIDIKWTLKWFGRRLGICLMC